MQWAKIARRGKKLIQSLDEYVAWGTGLTSTKRKFPKLFSPNDPQRDIVWVHKDDPSSELLMLKGLSKRQVKRGGNVAGLQIKVSKDANYVLDCIKKKNDYKVPVVYFDLANDFEKVRYPLLKRKLRQKGLNDERYLLENVENDLDNVQLNLIRGKDVDPDLHEELKEYSIILKEVLSGNMRVDELGKIRELSTALTINYEQTYFPQKSQLLTIPK